MAAGWTHQELAAPGPSTLRRSGTVSDDGQLAHSHRLGAARKRIHIQLSPAQLRAPVIGRTKLAVDRGSDQ